MNLEKEMQEYVLKEVSVWNEDGNRQKFLPQQDYLNLCEAISIAKQYAEEMCKKQKEICANSDFYQPDYVAKCYCEVDCDVIRNAPLATEEKQNER